MEQDKNRPIFTPFTRINFKYRRDLSVNYGIIQVLEGMEYDISAPKRRK